MTKEPKRASTIRMSEEAWKALERMASIDSRSLSSWVEHTVRETALKRGTWSPRALKATPGGKR